MVNFLSSWVKNLSLAIIVVSILEMLLPNNKTKKYIRMVMGLYILFSILSPLIKNKDKFNLDEFNAENYINKVEQVSKEEVNQTSMNKGLEKIYTEELEKDITTKVEKKGYIVEDCKVNAFVSDNNSGINKIILKITKKNNNDNEQNNNEPENTTIEDKVVGEVQKIQKVTIKVSNNTDKKVTENDDEKISNNDIQNIKKFLVEEYGVSEECLKIS